MNCWYCGRELFPQPPNGRRTSSTRTTDHKLAKVRGGGDEVSNLVDSCWACNACKKIKTVEEYRLWLYCRQPQGKAQQLVATALCTWPDMPEEHQRSLMAFMDYVDANYPKPVFFGERK